MKARIEIVGDFAEYKKIADFIKQMRPETSTS
jgi:hypothetical protein